MTDRQLMERAIEMAAQCSPERDDIPRVGAVIAVGGDIIAAGHRGTDDHAELVVLNNVRERSILPSATVYTTLEPCTHHVRRKKGESCTERLVRAAVRKVYIGILDPNQHVCGRGVHELQEHKIEVELFPHDLAQRIRLQNDPFILSQKELGIRILEPAPGQRLEAADRYGSYRLVCECINPPGPDVFAFSYRKGSWWPQPGRLTQIGDSDRWETQINFGDYGPHTTHLVRANELGVSLIGYYWKVVGKNQERTEMLRGNIGDEFLARLPGEFPGIAMPPRLPKGLDTQASITVEIVETAGTAA